MYKLILAVIVSMISISSVALAHPCDECTPEDLPLPYGKAGRALPSSWSINDVLFIDTYPDPASLTDAEKYMIAGATNASTGEVLFPWESRVQQVAMMYYKRYGYLPDQLTQENIAAAFGVATPAEVPGNFLYELASPLTGQYPRLDAINPSPGDVFMHILTEDEKSFIASQDQASYDLWYSGSKYDAYEKGYHCVDLDTLVVSYTRTYGWNGIIHTCLVSGYRRDA